MRIALFIILIAPSALRAQSVEFNRDIRPILSDNCFQCHGPDSAKRKAGLRLDTEAGAKDVIKGELLERVSSADDKKRMPPASTGKRLTSQQIDLLRRWIEQGAKWQAHWSFIAPRRPALPKVQSAKWPRNAIDHFILARLESEGLSPSPEADKTTLIRRVTLDLTGLPPTPAEVDAFLADSSANAFEKVVDRLLASPRYGERMASRWLDLARYADTNGYQTDGARTMWRWRDWVIDAYNRNVPFDQFTIEQIAGDMLKDATLDQKIATGFNRNHRGNSEGGVIPEEYAVEYVVDRVDTTSTVWLGLTMGCAKCHDHKYDPVSQKEFYQVFAYFNNVPERGKAIKYGNSPPYIKSPTKEQQFELIAQAKEIKALEMRISRLEPNLAMLQKSWEDSLPPGTDIDWTITAGLHAHLPLDEASDKARFRDGDEAFAKGPYGKAAVFDGKRYIDAGKIGDFGFFDKFTVAAWVYPEGKSGTILSRMDDTDRLSFEGAEGYQVLLQNGHIHVNLVKRWLDDSIRVQTEEPIQLGEWQHIAVTYDGSRLAAGVSVYIDGEPQKLKVNLDDLNQSFKVREPFRIGAGGGPRNRFRGLVDDVRIFNRRLPDIDVALVAMRENISEIVAWPSAVRTEAQRYKLRAFYVDRFAPDGNKRAYQSLDRARQRLEELEESIPTTMVMEEMPTPRDTHILIRGEYDRKGVKVSRGLPASLPGLPKDAPNNRLGFAKWLVDPSNPLTARVAVNREWQMFFGNGIVKTLEDFGSQGEWPSHPELLDWLAVEFMKSTPPAHAGGSPASLPRKWEESWNLQHIQRLIVTSAAYRQASRTTKEQLQKDPDNRLISRGPRYRLSAEMIRDQALFAGGLLVEKRGGPSVKPYQPAGLEKELHGTETYKQDHGENLYRRSLYTFWRRTVPPPAMMTFDSAGRETCVVRESRTNTPLQALNLMNDVTYVEAARSLAQRAIREHTKTDDRLAYAFQLLTSRRPKSAELDILRTNLNQNVTRFQQDEAAARNLLAVGESPRDDQLNITEHAAYTVVASLIMNLDEVITKE